MHEAGSEPLPPRGYRLTGLVMKGGSEASAHLRLDELRGGLFMANSEGKPVGACLAATPTGDPDLVGNVVEAEKGITLVLHHGNEGLVGGLHAFHPLWI